MNVVTPPQNPKLEDKWDNIDDILFLCIEILNVYSISTFFPTIKYFYSAMYCLAHLNLNYIVIQKRFGFGALIIQLHKFQCNITVLTVTTFVTMIFHGY